MRWGGLATGGRAMGGTHVRFQAPVCARRWRWRWRCGGLGGLKEGVRLEVPMCAWWYQCDGLAGRQRTPAWGAREGVGVGVGVRGKSAPITAWMTQRRSSACGHSWSPSGCTAVVPVQRARCPRCALQWTGLGSVACPCYAWAHSHWPPACEIHPRFQLAVSMVSFSAVCIFGWQAQAPPGPRPPGHPGGPSPMAAVISSLGALGFCEAL